MKSLMFKKDSWHYKLVNFIEDGRIENKINICSYRWLVIKGLIGSLVLGTILAGLAGLLLMIITDTLFVIIFQEWFFTRGTAIMGVIITGAAISWAAWFFAIYPSIKYFAKKIAKTTGRVVTRKNKDQTDNFIIQSWKSLKDKYCVQVEFID
jgi:hypothetical protein